MEDWFHEADVENCPFLRNHRGVGDRSCDELQFFRHLGGADYLVVCDYHGSRTVYECLATIDAGFRTRPLRRCGPQ